MVKNRIFLHAHCRNCMGKKPANQSPSEWSRTDAGLTDTGVQVWCKRCRMEIVHYTPAELQALIDDPPRCDCCPGGRHSTFPN